MMQTKLLFFSHHFPSRAAPNIALYNRQQLEHVAKYCELKVCAGVGWIDWFKRGPAGRENDTELDAVYFPYFYTPKVFRRLYGWLMYISARARFSALMKHNPDVILVCWAYPDVVAISKLVKPYGIPFVAKVIGSDVNLYCQIPELRVQIVDALEKASAVVCVSEALKGVLVECGLPEAKIHVVYNGVNGEKFFPKNMANARAALGMDSDAKIVLFIGNLKRAKGAIDVVTAFRRIIESRPDEKYALVLVGDDVDRRLVEAEARQTVNLYPGADIRLAGRVPHDQLNDWINASDLVCLPSYSEGVPNVLLEAMSCGKPVVATRVGGIPEIVNPTNGVMVDAGDIDGLASAILEVLGSDWNPEAIRTFSNQFDWDANAREILGIADSAYKT